MASKWDLIALLCVLIPSQAAAYVLFDDAAEVMTTSVSRGGHIAWNMGCWLLALVLMSGARRNERRDEWRPAGEVGLGSTGVARLAPGDR